MLSFDEALATLMEKARPVAESESVPTQLALGRVLAQDVRAVANVPPLDNSSMDGYAVRCADLGESGGRLQVAQRIPAGSTGQPLRPGTAARIFTGAAIPEGCDAVVMQEECETGDGWVQCARRPRPGEWIRRAGEDIGAGTVVLQAGTRLRAQELGQAASAGMPALTVYRRLRVAVFFTGDEIVMPGEPLLPGQIYNSNRYTLSGLLRGLGCEVLDLGICPDRLDATVDVLRRAAAQADVVVTSGGVSVGEEDHIKPAVETLGRLDVWKIGVKPGKPLAFGQVNGAAFVGLPGNPVSVFATFGLIVRPFILRCQGAREVAPLSYEVRADFDWPRPDRRREFLRARVVRGASGETRVEIFPNQSSGVLTSTVWADGLVDVPAGQPVGRGDWVRFIPFSELVC